MSVGGTAAYEHEGNLPALVVQAVEMARALSFAESCRPEQGRLLSLLARGRDGGVIGETGTGCGVGTAWMASAVSADTRLVTVEHDQRRAAAATALFAEIPHVTVIHGDWRELRPYAAFDLLVLDGGGSGKGGAEAADPNEWLSLFGLVVVDDFAPSDAWPPMWQGRPDTARLLWLEHPSLLATEVRLARDLASVVALHRPSG